MLWRNKQLKDDPLLSLLLKVNNLLETKLGVQGDWQLTSGQALPLAPSTSLAWAISKPSKAQQMLLGGSSLDADSAMWSLAKGNASWKLPCCTQQETLAESR